MLNLVRLSNTLELWAPSAYEAQWQYEEIFDLGCYDEIRLPDRAFVLDVGANIGLFSFFIRDRYPESEIHAFEPMPEVTRALRRNLHRYDMPGVRVTEYAPGSQDEEDVPFTYYPVLPGNSTRYPEEKDLQKAVMLRTQSPEEVERKHAGYTVTTPVRRLSSYLAAGRHVDLLKIDVEGAEFDVLRGIDSEHWHQIHQVVLEVQDLDGRVRSVVDMLRSHGFSSEVRLSPLIPPDILTYLVMATR